LAILLEGKKIAEGLKTAMKEEIRVLREKYSRTPLLVSVQIGQHAASGVYIKAQGRVAEDLGIDFRVLSLPEDISKKNLHAEITKLNKDLGVHTIMIQAPLPQSLDFDEVVSMVCPKKDAEGLHPQNLGKIVEKKELVAPCTPEACMEFLRYHNIDLYGKEAVIVGHSKIVGKPLSLLLMNKLATTTVCHVATSQAGRLQEHVKRADILIVAVGKPNLIKGSWIKEGAVVIDVGINRVGGSIVGDVEFHEAEKRASYITPVPGGVGPLTVTMLMRNSLELFKRSFEKNDI